MPDIFDQIHADAPASSGGGDVFDQIHSERPEATWMQKLQHSVGEWWNQVNPIEGVKGLAQATSHPLDAIKSYGAANGELVQKAEDAFKKGDYAMGFHHGLAYLLNGIPGVGTTYDKAAGQANEGDLAGAAGNTAGLITNLLAPEFIKRLPTAVGATVQKVVGGVPERLYQSALKPPVYNSAVETQALVKTGLENNIPVSEGGAKKLSGLIDNLGTAIKARIAASSNRGATVDPASVATRADQVANDFSKQVAPSKDLKMIDQTKQDFLAGPGAGPMPIGLAQDVKVGTYQQLRGKYTEMKSAQIEAEKALARGLKEEIETQMPELKGLNSKQAALLQLQPLLERAVNRISNREIFGIGTPIMAGAGGALGGTEGAAAGASLAMLKAVLDNPVIKSRLAVGLHRATSGGAKLGTKLGVKPMSVAAGLGRVNAFVKSLDQPPAQLPQAAGDQQPMSSDPLTRIFERPEDLPSQAEFDASHQSATDRVRDGLSQLAQ